MSNLNTTEELEIIYSMNVDYLIRKTRKEERKNLYEEWFQDYEQNLQRGLNITQARKEATRNLRERVEGALVLAC